LLYLANDVIQHAKKKKLLDFVGGFQQLLNNSIALFNDNSIKKSVLRVLKIWKERGIYSSTTISDWEAKLESNAMTGNQSCRPPSPKNQEDSPVTNKIVAEFRLNQVMESLDKMQTLERDSTSKNTMIAGKSFPILNIDIANHLKDKTVGDHLMREADEAVKILELAVSSLEQEVLHRKKFTEDLTKALIYYVVQGNEVDTEFKAYIKIGQNVAKVLKKMTEKPPEAPTDAPSPTNSDEGPILPTDKPGDASKVTSLDKRLEDILHGRLMVNNGSATVASNSPVDTRNIPYPKDPYTANQTSLSNKPVRYPVVGHVQSIQSVISSRPQGVIGPSHENLEPSDMDIGNSDEEDNSHNFSSGLPYPPPHPPHPPTNRVEQEYPSIPGFSFDHPPPQHFQQQHHHYQPHSTSAPYHRPLPHIQKPHHQVPPPTHQEYNQRSFRERHEDWQPRESSRALGTRGGWRQEGRNTGGRRTSHHRH